MKNVEQRTKNEKCKSDNERIEYVLTMNPDQARAALNGIELLMRLKLGQYDQIPYKVLDIGRNDYCDRRDAAKMYLEPAFRMLLGEEPYWKKDDYWYRLYNLYQVLRKAIHDAEYPQTIGVDSYEPRAFTEEPLPGMEWRKVNDERRTKNA